MVNILVACFTGLKFFCLAIVSSICCLLHDNLPSGFCFKNGNIDCDTLAGRLTLMLNHSLRELSKQSGVKCMPQT